MLDTGLGSTSGGSTVGCKPGHDSPWTLLRAPTQSGRPQATTSLSTVGCKPGHDTARINSVPASTCKMSTVTSVRRSVTFNPQGWETVFDRYPREVSRSSAVDESDIYWAYGSTQWYCFFVFPFVLGSVYASSTSTSSGTLRRLLTLCTSRYIR